MNEFFSQVVGFLEVLFQFVVNLVEGLLLAINVLFNSSSFVLFVGAVYMPAIIGASVMIVVAVSVVKFIIAR